MEIKGRRKLSRKRKIQLVVVFCLLITGWFVWRQLTAPVTGTQIKSDGNLRTTTIKRTPSAEPSSVSGQYFQLSLPAGYRPQENSQPTQGLLQQKTIIKSGDFGSTVINISVKTLPEGGLQGDSSYALRTGSPARYRMTSVSTQGQNVSVALDNQSAAAVGFWVHGNYLATVSVATALSIPSPESTKEQLEVLQTVLDSWQWQ